MALPDCFCWTRFGAEAGQTSEQILARKEQERIANRGCFLWGVGNAVGPSVKDLVLRTASPEVLFSPIKSTPRAEHVAPAAVVAWTQAETLTGEAFQLPSYSLVTSRYDPSAPRGAHYALVCFSDQPLTPSRSQETIYFSALRNLRSGRRLGASQVTAVVRRDTNHGPHDRDYDVAIRAKLVSPYFIRLQRPVPIKHLGADWDWAEEVCRLWSRRLSGCPSAKPRPAGLLQV